MEHDPDQPGAPFLARWAKRKAKARQSVERSVEPSAPPAEDRSPDAAAAPLAEAPDDRPLPSVNDILPDSKLTEFLEKRIPDELQRLALRKAWASDPAISGFIEMAENQWDWNTPGGAPGWGPLNAGANLEMLLAQATGTLPPNTEKTNAARDVVAGDAHADSMACDNTTQPQHTVEPATEPSDNAASQQGARSELSSSDNAPLTHGHRSPELLALDHEQVDSAPDMRQKAQREAAQQASPPNARRHGGALPRIGRTAET
jgi:hypothetical protein